MAKYSNLFGFKVGEFLKSLLKKDNKYYDVCMHSCLLDDFLKKSLI